MMAAGGGCSFSMAGMTRKRKAQQGSEGSSTVPQDDGSLDGIAARQARSVAVDAHWARCTRTAAWDDLWRRIFSDLFEPDEQELSATSLEEESDD